MLLLLLLEHLFEILVGFLRLVAVQEDLLHSLVVFIGVSLSHGQVFGLLVAVG